MKVLKKGFEFVLICIKICSVPWAMEHLRRMLPDVPLLGSACLRQIFASEGS
jgi:hypothetical protein